MGKTLGATRSLPGFRSATKELGEIGQSLWPDDFPFPFPFASSRRMTTPLEESLRLLSFSSLEEVTPASLKESFRSSVLTHHPDKGGDPDLFKKIKHAYEILGDSIRRKKYDNKKIMLNKSFISNFALFLTHVLKQFIEP